MNRPRHLSLFLALLATLGLPSAAPLRAAPPPTNTFVVAAYNVENWLSMDRRGTPAQPKPDEEKDAVVKILGGVQPDVLGVIEMGTQADLGDLADRLAARGLAYPHREWVQGADTDRHLALLSRFPIVARDPQTNSFYRVGADRFGVSRGFLDATIGVGDLYRVRVVMAHLKSKRAVEAGDQAQMRVEEGRLLREHVARILARDPRQNLLVMGDLNDTPESAVLRALIGTDPFRLVDLMPVDRRGYHDTYHFRWQKIYERIDYLLASPALHAEYVAGSARIADSAGWWDASDHRAIYARFIAADQDTDPAPAAAVKPGIVVAASAATDLPPGLSRGELITIVVVVFLAIDAVVLWWLLRMRRPPAGR